MIIIKVTRAMGGEITEQKKLFADQEAATKFLEALHFEKMNIACEAAGLGKFTPDKIVKNDKSRPNGCGYSITNKYGLVQEKITYALKIEIDNDPTLD